MIGKYEAIKVDYHLWPELLVYLTPHGILPRKGNPGDAGIDCFAAERVVARSFETTKVKLGFHCALIGHGNHWIEIKNRSGFGSKLGAAGVAGVIDSGYRGELIYSFVKCTHGDYIIEKGDKICQIIIHPFINPIDLHIREVYDIDELGTTERGSGGFGSTGG